MHTERVDQALQHARVELWRVAAHLRAEAEAAHMRGDAGASMLLHEVAALAQDAARLAGSAEVSRA